MSFDDWRLDMDPPGVLCKDCARFVDFRPRGVYCIPRRDGIYYACVEKTSTSVVTGQSLEKYSDALKKNEDGMCDEFEQKPRRKRRIWWTLWTVKR